jgi:hypothetical protein
LNIEELLSISKSQINIQHHNKPRDNKITIMDVDNLYSLTIEMKNSTAMTFDDAIGLDTYSSSETTVSSYLSIFETQAAKRIRSHGKESVLFLFSLSECLLIEYYICFFFFLF